MKMAVEAKLEKRFSERLSSELLLGSWLETNPIHFMIILRRCAASPSSPRKEKMLLIENLLVLRTRGFKNWRW